MPRTKPDQTITYRIEMGTKERMMLDSALASFQFNRIATPIVDLMKDVSGMIVLGAGLALIFPDIVLPTGKAGMEEVTTAIDQGIKQGMERARIERETQGEATLDNSTGIRDAIGRAWFNLKKPNWDFEGPGFREAWAGGPGRYF